MAIKRNDRRDFDTYELLLVRAGHHLVREIRRKGTTNAAREVLWGACELIWKCKRIYREEQRIKREAQGHLFAQRMRSRGNQI